MRLIYIETLASYLIYRNIYKWEANIWLQICQKKGNGKIFFFFFAADFEVATSSLTPTELSATCIRSFSSDNSYWERLQPAVQAN
jgi:hypothetical protein